MVVDIKVFSYAFNICITTFRPCEFEVYNTVDGKNNKEEKAWEVADIMIYHFSWKILQVGCDMQW